MTNYKWASWVLGGVFVGMCLASSGGCTGGGDTVISGLGNSDNVMGAAGIPALVAKELAGFEATPAISDEEIVASFAAIRARAMQGDTEAALVVLRVAAHQRKPGD